LYAYVNIPEFICELRWASIRKRKTNKANSILFLFFLSKFVCLW